jgi:hypothetical protein
MSGNVTIESSALPAGTAAGVDAAGDGVAVPRPGVGDGDGVTAPRAAVPTGDGTTLGFGDAPGVADAKGEPAGVGVAATVAVGVGDAAGSGDATTGDGSADTTGVGVGVSTGGVAPDRSRNAYAAMATAIKTAAATPIHITGIGFFTVGDLGFAAGGCADAAGTGICVDPDGEAIVSAPGAANTGAPLDAIVGSPGVT